MDSCDWQLSDIVIERRRSLQRHWTRVDADDLPDDVRDDLARALDHYGVDCARHMSVDGLIYRWEAQ